MGMRLPKEGEYWSHRSEPRSYLITKDARIIGDDIVFGCAWKEGDRMRRMNNFDTTIEMFQQEWSPGDGRTNLCAECNSTCSKDDYLCEACRG